MIANEKGCPSLKGLVKHFNIAFRCCATAAELQFGLLRVLMLSLSFGHLGKLRGVERMTETQCTKRGLPLFVVAEILGSPHRCIEFATAFVTKSKSKKKMAQSRCFEPGLGHIQSCAHPAELHGQPVTSKAVFLV